MSRADRVRIVGPLSQHLRAVERSLLARGYSRNSVNNRLGFTAQLSFWMHVQAVAPGALTELHLQAFVRGRRRVAPAFSRGYLGCVVKSLVEIGAISSPRPLPVPAPSRLDRTLEPFATYLRDERALKSASNQYVGIVRQFLVHRFGSQVPRLERITAHDLTEFVLREFRRSRVGSVKYSVTALRSYFRFLYVSGAIKQDLTGAIPAIAGWRLLGIPKGITPEHLSKILAAPDRRTRIGRRNLAILLLLSRLGLRRHEVASIALEDIDWRLGELRIRGKGDSESRRAVHAWSDR